MLLINDGVKAGVLCPCTQTHRERPPSINMAPPPASLSASAAFPPPLLWEILESSFSFRSNANDSTKSVPTTELAKPEALLSL